MREVNLRWPPSFCLARVGAFAAAVPPSLRRLLNDDHARFSELRCAGQIDRALQPDRHAT